MKQLIILFLLIFIPTSVYPQPEFAVSCDNVTKIRIMRFAAKDWAVGPGVPSEDGYFYLCNMQLTAEAAETLVALRLATPSESILINGWTCWYKNIAVMAHGVALQSSAPVWNIYNRLGVSLPFVREKDALEAARRVCPDLKPERSEGWPVQ